MNKWIKTKNDEGGIECTLLGLEDIGLVRRVALFEKCGGRIEQYRVEEDKSYIFVEYKEDGLKQLNRIPEEVIIESNYLVDINDNQFVNIT